MRVVGLAGAVDVVLLVGVALVSRRLRPWARSVVRSRDSTVEKAHRLRQAQAGWCLGFVGTGFLLMVASSVGRGPVHHAAHPTTTQNGWSLLQLGTFVCYLGGLLAVRRAIRPSVVEVRGIEKKIPHKGRHIAVGLVFTVAVAVAVPYAVVLAVAPRHGADRLVVVTAGYVVVILLANALLAPLWPVALKAEVLPTATHRRLMELSQRLHGRVRDIRSYPGRSHRTANAVQVGILPGRGTSSSRTTVSTT